ncbi:hypothetical protein N9V75_01725, partial [Luminiphilus sp.]|nr:hypothetical protein [Luminiphilus sp.]
ASKCGFWIVTVARLLTIRDNLGSWHCSACHQELVTVEYCLATSMRLDTQGSFNGAKRNPI